MTWASLIHVVYLTAIAELTLFVILEHAHRQIHAEDARGVADSAGPRLATERF
jgi:hypothetical protein